MSCLHGLFYGTLLCAVFGITPSLYMGTVMRDENLSCIPIYFLTNHFVNHGISKLSEFCTRFYTTDWLICLISGMKGEPLILSNT